MYAGVDIWSASFTEEMTDEDKEEEIRIRFVYQVLVFRPRTRTSRATLPSPLSTHHSSLPNCHTHASVNGLCGIDAETANIAILLKRSWGHEDLKAPSVLHCV